MPQCSICHMFKNIAFHTLAMYRAFRALQNTKAIHSYELFNYQSIIPIDLLINLNAFRYRDATIPKEFQYH